MNQEAWAQYRYTFDNIREDKKWRLNDKTKLENVIHDIGLTLKKEESLIP
jgi:hypothetical protein